MKKLKFSLAALRLRNPFVGAAHFRLAGEHKGNKHTPKRNRDAIEKDLVQRLGEAGL